MTCGTVDCPTGYATAVGPGMDEVRVGIGYFSAELLAPAPVEPGRIISTRRSTRMERTKYEEGYGETD